MEVIEGKAYCTRILFNKGNFTIALFKPSDDDGGMPSSFSIKGDIFVKPREEYKIHAELDTKTNYEDSYNAIRVARDIDLNKEDKESVRVFLETATTEKRAEAIMSTLDDPIEALENRDIVKLSTVHGVGNATAEKIIEQYYAHKDYSSAYIGLSKYGLTTDAIKKICDTYGDPDKAVEIVNENPYRLTEVDGYGFTRADSIFLNVSGNKPTDKRRVRAYIEYMFEQEEDNGNSWMTPRDFIAKLREFIPNADLKYAVDYVQNSDDYMYLSSGDDKRLTTRRAYNLEVNIVKELNRLMSAKSTMKLDGYSDSIRLIEKQNGWKYSDEQREAIESMVDENVYMLQGLAGSGKSTTVNAFLSAVEAHGYSYSQCALSGKAADNLTNITGKQGYTIHSLLGYDHEKEGFKYDEDYQLPANVVVLDELSMVNAQIFYSLIKAIKTGSKLIMIGDYGQLEAIGVGVMGGMISSKKVPMTLLKKIHRQAQDSAIITHSINVRGGNQPKELDLKGGVEDIYGVKKDLKYIVVGDDDEDKILSHSISEFKKALENYDISDVQIITPTRKVGKSSTYDLNRLAQMVYNPSNEIEFIELGYKDARYRVKVGDKVINTKNNRNTLSPSGVVTPIYNGNTGVVTDIKIDDDGERLLIDFDGIGAVSVEGDSVKNIELGYAITVHKSQGSTIKCVIFALPFHYLLNTKELAYTGMTRASDYQVVITSPRSFRRAIRTTSVSKKKTHIKSIFEEEFANE